MKAWRVERLEGPRGLELVDLDPPVCAPGEVLIEVHAAGLNFSDLLMTQGAYQVRPALPFVAGLEIAGRVVKSAAGSRWPEGVRVAAEVASGGFAQFACAPEMALVALPENMSYADGACLPVVWPTAWIALFERAKLQRGECVLVHAAAGGTGSAAVQLARAAGATVIAGVGDDAKLSHAIAAGASHTLNTRHADWPQRVRELSGGSGVDVVFDPVGGDLAEGSLKCLARNGRYLIVGFAGGKIPALRTNQLLLKNASALGVYWTRATDADSCQRAIDHVLQGRRDGTLRVQATGRIPFERLREAMADLAARRTSGKWILDMGTSDASTR